MLKRFKLRRTLDVAMKSRGVHDWLPLLLHARLKSVSRRGELGVEGRARDRTGSRKPQSTISQYPYVWC